jgi:hypothetical protein
MRLRGAGTFKSPGDLPAQQTTAESPGWRRAVFDVVAPALDASPDAVLCALDVSPDVVLSALDVFPDVVLCALDVSPDVVARRFAERQ